MGYLGSRRHPWMLYYHGFSYNPGRSGIGWVLQNTYGGVEMVGSSFWRYKGTHYRAEYWALIKGLEAAHQKGVRHIVCYGDCYLVNEQVLGNLQTLNGNLQVHLASVIRLRQKFGKFDMIHIDRDKNKHANWLARTSITLLKCPSN